MCVHQQKKNLTYDWIKIIKELRERLSLGLSNATMSIFYTCQFKKSNHRYIANKSKPQVKSNTPSNFA